MWRLNGCILATDWRAKNDFENDLLNEPDTAWGRAACASPAAHRCDGADSSGRCLMPYGQLSRFHDRKHSIVRRQS